MANTESQPITELTKPKSNPSLLTYEEYYDTLMFAKKIRLENTELLSNAKTPKEKTKIIEELFVKYNIPANASSDPKEKECSTLIKINIFVFDNNQFLADYKTKFGKNVRLISDAYQIPAPFVIQKVTEIGKYEQYLAQIEKEGGLGEPKIETDSIIDAVGALATSGALKSLYDPMRNVSGQKAATTTKKGRTTKKSDKKKIAEKEEKLPVHEQSATVSPSLPGIVSEELLHHIDSMQRYCTRLLDQNEELGSRNDSLVKFNKELEEILRRLRVENDSLKQQLALAATEKKDLETQIEKLNEEKLALTVSPIPSEPTQPRTISEETATERELRQEIADLKCANQELTDRLASEEDKKYHYRNRAVVAEAQLEQLQHGMQGIFKEVDALDLSFAEPTQKKS